MKFNIKLNVIKIAVFSLLFASYILPSQTKQNIQVDKKSSAEAKKRTQMHELFDNYVHISALQDIILDYAFSWEKCANIDTENVRATLSLKDGQSLYIAKNLNSQKAVLNSININDSTKNNCVLNNLKCWFTTCAISNNNKFLATANDNSIYLYNLEKKVTLINEIPRIGSWTFCLAFSPDNKYLVFPSDNGKRLNVWNLNKNGFEKILPLTDCDIKSISFTPDNKELITISKYKTVKHYDTVNWKVTQSYQLNLQSNSICTANVSSNCKYLALNILGDQNIIIMNLFNNKVIQTISDAELDLCRYINHFSFSDNYETLFVSTDTGIKVYKNFAINLSN